MPKKMCDFERCFCKRRVLVVDNNAVDRADHVEDLMTWGFEPIVAEGEGEALQADARRKVQAERCHVALVDLRLRDDYDQNDYSGMELVPDLKPAHAIIVTGFGTVPIQRTALTKYDAYSFFGKEERPEDLRDLIRHALDDVCVRNLTIIPESFLAKHIAPRLKMHNDVTVQDDEIRDLLAIMFPGAKTIQVEGLSRAVKTPSPHSMARLQRSIVIQATVDNLQPLVVKISAHDKITREVRNYRRYIEGQTGGNHHAYLERHERLWNVGGVAYRFIGDTDDETLYSHFYLRESDPTTLIAPLIHFFTQVWGDHYQQMASALPYALFECYDKLWNGALSKAMASWQAGGKYRTFPDLPGQFLNPGRWLAAHKAESRLSQTRQCIIHGDLHGDNLFADKNGHSWVIDFERTGQGHILTDFVELEQDILVRLTSLDTVDLPLFYELIIALTKPSRATESFTPTHAIHSHDETHKAFTVIIELRKLAADLCSHADNREYYWGLLLDALFISAVLDEAEDALLWQRSMLMASIVCSRLAHWECTEWPLKAWSPVNWVTTDGMD